MGFNSAFKGLKLVKLCVSVTVRNKDSFSSLHVTFKVGGYSTWGMILMNYHHLVPSLRISGYIPLLHLYAFMVWTGTTLLFNFAYTLSVSVTSGHFVPTSNSLSWYTVLSKLGKGVVPWVNFWFFIFLF